MMRNEEGECATMKSKKRKVDVDLENLVSEEFVRGEEWREREEGHLKDT